jgi:hypothetical protein
MGCGPDSVLIPGGAFQTRATIGERRRLDRRGKSQKPQMQTAWGTQSRLDCREKSQGPRHSVTGDCLP